MAWSEAAPLWEAASAEYAAGISGEAVAFRSVAASGTGMMDTIEIPILLRNGVRIIEKIVPWP
jgi:hypothetical protein